jgi:hypothetical protein
MLSTAALLASGCVSPNRNAPPIDDPVVPRPSIPVTLSRLDRSRLDDLVRTTHAEAGLAETRCYRFDQPYFAEIRFNAGRSATGPDTGSSALLRADLRAALRDGRTLPNPALQYLLDSTYLERTAIIRLEPDGHFAAVYTLPEARPDVARPTKYSWQLLPPRVLQLSGSTGYVGTTLRLAILGDSLSGTVVHWTHVMRRDSVTGEPIVRPQLPAHAVRVACPSRNGPS